MEQEAKPQYRLKLLMHMSLAKGGYHYAYEMVDYPGITVTKHKETRNSLMEQDIIFENITYKKVTEAIAAWASKNPEVIK